MEPPPSVGDGSKRRTPDPGLAVLEHLGELVGGDDADAERLCLEERRAPGLAADQQIRGLGHRPGRLAAVRLDELLGNPSGTGYPAGTASGCR